MLQLKVLQKAGLLLLVFFISSVVMAHEGDVAIQVINNKIVVGDWIIDGETLQPCSVFAGRFNDSGSDPNWTDTPGFDSAVGTWPTETYNYFNILGPVRLWNGTDISTLATQRIQMSYGANSIISPIDNSIVLGLPVNVSSSGAWHKHIGFTLLDSVYNNGFAADGIYVLTLELLNSSPSLTKSDPFYIVFRQDEIPNDGIGTLEQQEAAVAYLESIPEPGTIAMFIAGLITLAWRKRFALWGTA